MKKILIVVTLFIAVFLLFAYLFIPSTIIIISQKRIICPTVAVNRLLAKKENLAACLMLDKKNDSTLVHNNITNTIVSTNQFGVSLLSNIDDYNIKGSIITIGSNVDTSIVQIQYEPILCSNNPFARIVSYLKARTLKSQADYILSSLKSYSANLKNVYGFDVLKTKVKDSVYIFTEAAFNRYPTNSNVDSLINKLRNYVARNNGIESDFPMLNINTENNKDFTAMVAIPLKNSLPITTEIKIKHMFLGNILVAKIVGGQAAIAKAEAAFKNYVTDFGYVSPAIPYQSIETNRVTEIDSNKWITTLKYPIF